MTRNLVAGPPYSRSTSETAGSLTKSTPRPSSRLAPALVVAGPEKTIIHPARAGWSFVKPSVIPGFGLTLGYTVVYLSLIVLIPLAALFIKSATLPLDRIVA